MSFGAMVSKEIKLLAIDKKIAMHPFDSCS